MYYFIVNPNARSGLGKSIWFQIEPILKDAHVEYQVLFTKYRNHATKITRSLTSDSQTHTIIVLGGDGTVNEVINGISDLDKVILGYIPAGSSNDFARGFHLPTNPESALQNILHPVRIRHMDIGILKDHTKSRRFAVSTGLGFDAAICHLAMVSKLKVFLNKIHLGKLTYIGIALHQLLFCRPVKMTLTIDQQCSLTFDKVYFTAVMNHPFEGGGFQFCPNARTDDGLLDIIVVSDLPKWKILLLFPTAYRGLHTHFKGIHIFQGRKILLDSRQSLSVHTDGEPLASQQHVEITTANKQLRIISL